MYGKTIAPRNDHAQHTYTLCSSPSVLFVNAVQRGIVITVNNALILRINQPTSFQARLNIWFTLYYSHASKQLLQIIRRTFHIWTVFYITFGEHRE